MRTTFPDRYLATLSHRTYVICPYCNKGENRIDHVDPPKKAPYTLEHIWFCDECGGGYTITMYDKNKICVNPSEHRKSQELVLLRFEGADPPVYFVMKHDYWTVHGEHTEDNVRYYYEEHAGALRAGS